jgi:organic hydroperoxide reductase OsmC/OhrA
VSADDPSAQDVARVQQVERYEFRLDFPGATYPPVEVDEARPVGTGHGPNPVQMLAAAVAHCMSSTLQNALERAHVQASPISTRVRAHVGRNAAGRLRVQRLSVDIETGPLDESDRERFDRCVAIFEDYCTVSGAVREGVQIGASVSSRSPT